MLYVGEGPRGSNGACLTLLRLSIFHSGTHNQTGPLWCWFRSGWVCAHPRPLWVSPTTSPVRLGVSPAAAPTSMGIFNQRFEALFPWAGALGWAVCFASRRLSSLSVRECGAAGSVSAWTACAVCPTLRQSRSRHSHVSPLHAGAHLRPSYRSGWMFIFYFLGVGPPCLSILCQFWLCEEAQCVYLRRHLGSPMFSFSMNCFPKWLHHFMLSPATYGFQFLHTPASICYVCHFYFSYPSGWEVVSHCGLMCSSLMTNVVEHLFIIPYIFFEDMSIQVFAHFKLHCLSFHCCILKNSL